ncbi:hypothetical protein BJ138DRAFT_1019640, partial [Hygrophoropsis aurantiaca]
MQRPATPRATQPNGMPFSCYSCGSPDHSVNDCERVNDLISRGVMKRDDRNRIIYADGSRIYRQGSETILQAYDRVGNFPSSLPRSTDFITATFATLVEEETDEEADVHAVVGRVKSTKEKRKEVFDGVFVPPAPRIISKGKEKENNPVSLPGPSKSAVTIPSIQPIDIHTTSFNPNNDNAIMEDATITAPKN